MTTSSGPSRAKPAGARDDRSRDLVARQRGFQQEVTRGSDLVVSTRGSLLVPRDGHIFPVGRYQLFLFEASQDRIDGAARKSGDVEYVEAVAEPVRQRVQDQRGRVGQLHGRNSTYVELRCQTALAPVLGSIRAAN